MSSRARGAIRDWRWPVIVALGVVLAGVLIMLLQPASPDGYLDPGSAAPSGARALADLLTARGQQVVTASAPVNAKATPNPATERSLELLTSPELLTSAQLAQAARFGGDILLVDPDPAALAAIAPRARQAAGRPQPPVVRQPQCTAQPAVLAGDAYTGGAALRVTGPAALACYPGDGGYYLVQYAAGGRTITVLGSGVPLTNQYLARNGDAALAMNIVRTARRIVWVVPSPEAQPPVAGGGGTRSFWSLLPLPVYLIFLQLCVAVLLAAAWRARRLGPLVAERLPVVVRASETVEGHGRLYQARRARDRAAGELRAAATGRIARLTGGAVSAETVAARTGQAPAEVASLLYGPPPANDEDLVALAASLDTLERKMRQS